eukprot:Opistho-1_new@46950
MPLIRNWSSYVMRRQLKEVMPRNSRLPPPLKKNRIITGDKVEVMVGPDKGMQGTVLAVLKLTSEVIVENVNMHPVYYKENGEQKTVHEERPIPYTDVQIVHPTTGMPTEVVYRYLKPPGRENEDVPRRDLIKTRVAKEGLVVLEKNFRRRTALVAEDGPKDTVAEDVQEKTFVPEAKTFASSVLTAYNWPWAPPPRKYFKPLVNDKMREHFRRKQIEEASKLRKAVKWAAAAAARADVPKEPVGTTAEAKATPQPAPEDLRETRIIP